MYFTDLPLLSGGALERIIGACNFKVSGWTSNLYALGFFSNFPESATELVRKVSGLTFSEKHSRFSN